MKKKLIVLVVTLVTLFALLRPLVAVSVDDFGLAVSIRESTAERFERLAVWEK